MIDSAWILSAVPEETAQAHSEIRPMKRINPAYEDRRLGGAGMTLMALRSICDHRDYREKLPYDVTLHGIGVWSERDDELMRRLAHADADGWRIKLHRLVTHDPATTTVKARFYTQLAADQPRLIARYDQDPPARGPDRPSPSSRDPLAQLSDLPNPDEIVAVVVADSNKGAVDKELIEALSRHLRGSECLWLIDSKRPDVLNSLPQLQVILTINREEVVRLCSIGSAPLPYGRQPTRELLNVLQELAKEIPKSCSVRCVVVKLDRDGACVLHIPDPGTAVANDKENVVLVHSRSALQTAGIAAGDFFNATLVISALSHTPSAKRKVSGTMVVEACEFAAAWLDFCEKYWASDMPTTLCCDNIKPEHFLPCPSKPFELGEKCREEQRHAFRMEELNLASRLNELDGFFDYAAIVRAEHPTIDLARGKGILGNFISTDIALRAKIRRFVDRIQEYTRATGPTRPLNCVIAAQPGSGKSFFVKQVAKATDCEAVEVNCSQVLSRDDLLESIARLQNVPAGRTPLLFLDEVDTDPNHYAFLLAPLWDSSVTIRGHQHRWRERMVSILVVSKPTKYTRKRAEEHKELERLQVEDFVNELRDASDGTTKARDLGSRLNGEHLTLAESYNETSHQPPKDALTSRVYLAIQLILQYHATARLVESGLLDLIYGAPTFNARTVEQFVADLRSPDDGVVRLRRVGKKRVEDFARNLGYELVRENGEVFIRNSRHLEHFGGGDGGLDYFRCNPHNKKEIRLSDDGLLRRTIRIVVSSGVQP